MCMDVPSLVRELQQDVRELNQADLSEVDPEENSAEFMGILIKVHTVHEHYSTLRMLLIWNFHTSNMLHPPLCSILLFQCVCVLASSEVLVLSFLLQALAKLKKIPETIKAIMERLEPELKQIVKRSTTQIADHAYQRGENLAQESQPRYSKETGRIKKG